MTDEIITVSTPYLPGYRITKTIGFTWGLIVRSRGLGRNITAGLRSLARWRNPRVYRTVEPVA